MIIMRIFSTCQLHIFHKIIHISLFWGLFNNKTNQCIVEFLGGLWTREPTHNYPDFVHNSPQKKIINFKKSGSVFVYYQLVKIWYNMVMKSYMKKWES